MNDLPRTKLRSAGEFFRTEPHVTRLVAITFVWLAFLAITRFDRFYSLLNFQTMAAQFPEYGLMSLGIMLCMITGGIDLSLVGIANLTGILMAHVLLALTGESGELPAMAIPAVFALGAVVGLSLGFFNSVLITRFNISPILATLGAGELFKGISMAMTNGAAVSRFSSEYALTVNNRIFGDLIPVQTLVFVGAVFFIWVLLTRTTYGPKLYLLGTNPVAARFSGLKTRNLLTKTYVLSGLFAGVAGMVMLGNYNSARADYGAVYTLQSIMIVILGGVSPFGGKGRISGVVLAIVLVQLLQTGINRFPVINSFFIFLLWGSALLLVMVLDVFSDRNGKQKKKKQNSGEVAATDGG
ncbi:MAG: ABC transporter permease [Spirochaeta sp.]|jgi:simple sugar transport system permease protein|nr:ABC transporter permease [Spirochaeta sp.]